MSSPGFGEIGKGVHEIPDAAALVASLCEESSLGLAIWHADGAPFLANALGASLTVPDDAFQRVAAGATVQLAETKLFPLKGADGKTYVAARHVHVQRAPAAGRDEARFRLLARSGILGILIASGGQLDLNDALLKMVGYERDDILSGRVKFTDLTPPDWRHADAHAMEEIALHGFATPFEKEYVRKDGTRVPVLVGVTKDETNGDFVAFMIDRTEHKRIEAALQASENRFRGFQESGVIGIVVTDTSGGITEANDAFLDLLGYSQEDLRNGLVNGRALNTPEREQTDAVARQELKEKGVAHAWEKELLHKDGHRVPVLMGVVVTDEAKQESVAFALDLTERRKAAEAEILRREKDAAQAANAELETFSYSVAHDLRAPLRAISGFNGLVLEDNEKVLDDASKSLLRRSMASAERMGQLIDALLELARLSRAKLRVESVDLTQIAASVVEQLQTAEPERRVEVVIAPQMTARGDATLLRAVLENLLRNSWKFTRHQETPRIEVGQTTNHDDLELYVRDNGAGFDMSQAKLLFGAFQRLHSTKQFEGTGVGLATVQRIIHRHGGRIWAEAEEGRGATFRFTLPAAPA